MIIKMVETQLKALLTISIFIISTETFFLTARHLFAPGTHTPIVIEEQSHTRMKRPLHFSPAAINVGCAIVRSPVSLPFWWTLNPASIRGCSVRQRRRFGGNLSRGICTNAHGGIVVLVVLAVGVEFDQIGIEGSGESAIMMTIISMMKYEVVRIAV